jgi:hypothetical protein
MMYREPQASVPHRKPRASGASLVTRGLEPPPTPARRGASLVTGRRESL